VYIVKEVEPDIETNFSLCKVKECMNACASSYAVHGLFFRVKDERVRK